MSKFGFYDYDKAAVGTDGVIYKEDLTSEPTSGYNAISTPVFNSTGMVCAAATIGGQFTGISGQAGLNVEGTLRFMCTAGAWETDTDIAATQNFIVFKAGTTCIIQKIHAGTADYIKFNCSVTLDGKQSGVDQWAYLDSAGWETVDGLVEVIFTWDQGGVQLWIDRLKIFDVNWVNSATRPTMTEINLNTQGANGGTYTWKDLLISDKKMVIKSSTHRTRNIIFYGDSYTQQGNYPQVDTSGRQCLFHFSPSDETGGNAPYFTEDGRNGANFDGVAGGATGARRDVGMIPQCHRQLTKKGLYTHKVRFWGEGGAGYVTNGGGSGVDMEARVDVSLNGNYGIPNIAVVVAGYNDASGGAATADIQTAAQGIVDALKAVNSNIKIIMTTAPYNTDMGHTLAAHLLVNDGITAAANANDEVTLVDMYTYFGGATNDSTIYFLGDNIHPDQAGQALYGNKIAEAIIAAV